MRPQEQLHSTVLDSCMLDTTRSLSQEFPGGEFMGIAYPHSIGKALNGHKLRENEGSPVLDE